MTRAFKQGFMDKLAQLDPAFIVAMQDIAAHGTPAVSISTPPPASTNAPASSSVAPAAVAANSTPPPSSHETQRPEDVLKPEDLKLEEKPGFWDSVLADGPNPNVAAASIPFLQNLDLFKNFDDVKMTAKNFLKNPSFSYTWRF